MTGASRPGPIDYSAIEFCAARPSCPKSTVAHLPPRETWEPRAPIAGRVGSGDHCFSFPQFAEASPVASVAGPDLFDQQHQQEHGYCRGANDYDWHWHMLGDQLVC